jgi:hypothetical protein
MFIWQSRMDNEETPQTLGIKNRTKSSGTKNNNTTQKTKTRTSTKTEVNPGTRDV